VRDVACHLCGRRRADEDRRDLGLGVEPRDGQLRQLPVEFAREREQVLDAGECILGGGGREVLGLVESGSLGELGVPAVLAGEQARGQRVVGDHREVAAFARRHDLVLDPALEQVPLDLGGHEPGQAALGRGLDGVVDLRGGTVGARDVAHLARPDQLVERAEGVLYRHGRVRGVLVVQVDVVDAEPAQAGVARLPDVVGRGTALRLAHRCAELRCDHGLVASARQCRAEDLLRLAGRVDVGGVEERDAVRECGVDDRARLIGVDPGAEVVAAQRDRRDDEIGSRQGRVLHVCGHRTPDAGTRMGR